MRYSTQIAASAPSSASGARLPSSEAMPASASSAIAQPMPASTRIKTLRLLSAWCALSEVNSCPASVAKLACTELM